MNRDEAKFILGAYRAGGQDAQDPQFREALELLKRDPELARWFAQEQAIDQRLSDKLHAFPVPPELTTQLLAARKIVRPNFAWRRTIRTLAAAIVFLLIAGGGLWGLRAHRQAQLAEFRATMLAATTEAKPHVEAMNLNISGVRQWLAEHGADAEIDLPAGLASQTRVGCRIVEWRGHTVSLVCFQLAGGQHVDMFVLDAIHLPGVSAAPTIVTQDDMSAAAWRDRGKVYLLASRGSADELRGLL